MNGAMFDSTFNIFFKLKIAKTYDAMLSTPLAPADIALGELTWALMRATVYSTAFLVVMAGFGYVLSPWAVLCLPGRHADQLRLRRHGHGGHVVHAQLAGLRQGLPRHHPAVPLLGHLLSPIGVPGVAPGRGPRARRCTRGWPCSAASTPGICRLVARSATPPIWRSWGRWA